MAGRDGAALDRLRGEPDAHRRRLVALELLTERLAAHGIEPIVGGGALEFYTAGGYATTDTDLALPVAPEVDAAFADLGFTKEGRYWIHADLDLLFEAPAPAGLPGEDAPRTEVDVDGLRVVIIGVTGARCRLGFATLTPGISAGDLPRQARACRKARSDVGSWPAMRSTTSLTTASSPAAIAL